jgi:D-alanyl-lipoteichoic acid acyltransferase DltB (MBOAT superfamily)
MGFRCIRCGWLLSIRFLMFWYLLFRISHCITVWICGYSCCLVVLLCASFLCHCVEIYDWLDVVIDQSDWGGGEWM